MSSVTRVLALVPYPLKVAPGQRYRIEQWEPYLRDLGVDVHFEPFAGPGLAASLYLRGQYSRKAYLMCVDWVRRLRAISLARNFDVVYVHREATLIGPAWIERVVRRQNPRIVYDFDDAVWLPYVSPRNRYLSYFKAAGKTRTICHLARVVTVGNEYLAAFARQHNSAVTVMPSTVSLRDYTPRPRASQSVIPVIGWTGSHSSIQYLRVVEGALRRLARTRQFQLQLVGVEEHAIEGVDVRCRPWRAATEVEDLWAFDVGIMPLRDDPWTRGKCAMKAIQYMGVAVPAVVSPVGVNRKVVEHGVSGLHAESQDDWIRQLEALLDSPELRRRLGEAGRRRVEAEYSAEVQAPRLAALLRDIR